VNVKAEEIMEIKELIKLIISRRDQPDNLKVIAKAHDQINQEEMVDRSVSDLINKDLNNAIT
jgi:hypothetical protein